MKIVCLDTETGGLDPRQHQVIEVAWQVFDGDDMVSQLRLPHYPHLVSPEAAAINNYYGRNLQDPSTWAGEADLAYLEDVLDGATLLGANPAFDAEFMAQVFPNRPWHYRLLDIESMAHATLLLKESWGLAKIAEYLRTESKGFYEIPEPDHTAAGDVRTTVAVYRALRNYVHSVTVGAVRDFLQVA